ncbi:MAG TPA: AraC family transcriptional regulator [Bryobacteraceae bacterium]
MAKIAIALQQALTQRAANGELGRATRRVLARGKGWTVSDVICTSGPSDRSFEERHSCVSIALVAAGTFQYRCGSGRDLMGDALMTPGSLLLGNPGESFECGHQHASGDRCLAFHYAPEYFEGLLPDPARSRPAFRIPRLPPLRELSPLVARLCAGLAEDGYVPWQELGALCAARIAELVTSVPTTTVNVPPAAIARVTSVVRLIERHPDAALDLENLAQTARLSPYHFLRTFERLTGVTPHQFVLRARLREAALRLSAPKPARLKILDIALDCGFADVSNFNRSFRTEFGVTPREYAQPRELH